MPTSAATEADGHLRISLLTGGSDRPYVFGLVTSLVLQEIDLDLIGSDELDLPVYRNHPQICFLNLRGSAVIRASFRKKTARILRYYARLIRYAIGTPTRLFHILWNNKFKSIDRTVLMLFYRLLGKRVVLTVHNVNTEKRDGYDSRYNRLTLKIQYQLCSHLFTHTDGMKRELIEDYGVPESRITVIPFGINNAVPVTALTPGAAKRRLSVQDDDKTILFFGRITPYKGLDLLLNAFRSLHAEDSSYRLIIAGRDDRCDEYWQALRADMAKEVSAGTVILHNSFIPDEDTEIYFKAADVTVLPYREVYQSGVLFLSLSFGLPVVAADVGSFRDEIVEGLNGAMFPPGDCAALADKLRAYFESPLYRSLEVERDSISARTARSHSWTEVSETTARVYRTLLRQAVTAEPQAATLAARTVDRTQ